MENTTKRNSRSKCDVLITYSWNRVGYNILRSLSSLGLRVWVADTSKINICSVSSFSAGSFVYPDPFTQEEKFLECLLHKIDELKPKVLIPTHDESIVIAKHISRFPKEMIIPISDYETLIMLSDKACATKLAQETGVPIPQIYHSVDDVKEYPMVFKTVVGNSAKGVYFPNSMEELQSLIVKYDGIKTLMQEKALGTDYSVDCIRMKGYFQASVYRALITKTEGGGTTTQRIIVDQPILVEYAKRILDKADYYGVCGLDFKYDDVTHRAAFIEVNARYTGGLATPIAAGFDIPKIHYILATNKPFDENAVARVGTKTKWILGDIITLVGRLLTLRLSKNELKSVARFKGFDAFDDYRSDDKKAILGEMSYYLSKLVKNGKLNP